ncbi:hypothetical protein phiG2_26 [Lysinibacillus phage phiG2]|nr:hypothetical protein phiG2_26 [Lysinibacillus phage phiG2]
MRHKFEYKTMEEREAILLANQDKRLVAEENLFTGNFLIFEDATEMIVITKERLESLETSQLEQDKLILDLIYGGLN